MLTVSRRGAAAVNGVSPVMCGVLREGCRYSFDNVREVSTSLSRADVFSIKKLVEASLALKKMLGLLVSQLT